jgi:polysaccharide chain length determinant protein (PEP-CTERM system associated)
MIGTVWPLKYQTKATIYVDERNIIEPLLGGQAEIQRVNQAQEAKEKIYTRKILEKVARDAGLLSEKSDSREIASTLARLGSGANNRESGIQIKNTGINYIQVSYKDSDPERSFNIVTALINAFIRNIAESKRQESQDAFDFIENQADNYKRQLIKAEEKLKNFNVENRDGTEAQVNSRISELRSEIEELNLSINEIQSRRSTIKNQLQNEREYLNVRTQSDFYRQRIREDQSRLENLLISLTETHPDVVNLKLQIRDHQRSIASIEQQETQSNTQDNDTDMPLNPLYEELRSNLSDTEIALNAAINRESTLKKLLEAEYQRANRIAARRAELSELNRDYLVTQNLYEDMLSSKEKARLSMTLDIEGQGTSYKVHEPPTFPLEPSGLDAFQFMKISPILGLLVPIGIMGIYIFLDPRIRIPSNLSMIADCKVLAVTPPVKGPVTPHENRSTNILLIILLLFSTTAYAWISMTRIIGAS